MRNGVRVPPKPFQLGSQFCGAFAIIHGVVLLGCVRTSQYSEDHPRRTIITSKRSKPRGALRRLGSSRKKWGTSRKLEGRLSV